MRLLFHEKILGAITLLFVTFIFIFSAVHKQELNIVSGSEAASPYFVNINTADAAELDTLDGIGIKTADAIIQYRNKHGSFKKTSDLCNVSGIGSVTFEKIKDYIRV